MNTYNGSLVISIYIISNLFLTVTTRHVTSKHPPKLLLISMDGFKHDYLDIPGLRTENISNFQHFIEHGVRAEHVSNVFPSVTWPNHFSLLTGLYPESHGIVHNRFYDPSPDIKDSFWFDNRRDNYDPVWYDVGAEPIYVTNDKAGPQRRSGSAMIPSGIGKVKGIAPDRRIPDTDPFSHVDFDRLVDYVIDWFTHDTEPVNLALLYFGEPDHTSHKYGAGSTEVMDIIYKLNDAIGYLLKRLQETNLHDEMNIIITADHGFVNVTEILPFSDYDIIEGRDYTELTGFKNHGSAHLYSKNISELLQKFENATLKKKVSVYVKAEAEDDSYLKDVLHYRDNTRIGDVVVTATQEGVVLAKDRDAVAEMKDIGYHGFDPYKFKSMHPFFLAKGPAFKKNYSTETFNSVDIYPLMCHILDLQPAPNNGSFEHVKELLVAPGNEGEDNRKEEITEFTTTWVSYTVLIGICGLLGIVFGVCACVNVRVSHLQQKKSRNKDKHTENTSVSLTRL